MPGDGSALNTVLRRDSLVLVIGLIGVILVAWIWLVLSAGMSVSAVTMTRMSGMDGPLMERTVWTPAYAALMFFMWWVMMAAMMLPSATPVLLLFARISCKTHATDASLIPTSVFALGYLVAWGVFSACATNLQWMMEATRLMSLMLEASNIWLAAAILVLAGAWQLTPIKKACLRHCRTPLSFLIDNWQAGKMGALRMGFRHGCFCFGCCGFLMALLFFGGVMNLYWIIGLTVFIFLEKTVPFGNWFSKSIGVVLLGWGLLLPVL